MKKLWIFGLFLAVALIVFATLMSWYIFVYQSGSASMYGAMGQMMGGRNANIAYPMPTYVWYSLVALIVVMSAGIFGTVYYVVYPEIRRTSIVGPLLNKDQSLKQPSVSEAIPTLENATNDNKQSWFMLLRTSKPEERKILEILYSHNGTHLQKLIVKESGLTKLKTHRIISRFSERGIVNVSKSGNTNEVRLASWLSDQASGTSSPKTTS